MNKIEMGKKYRTRGGVKVNRVLCVDRRDGAYPVVVELELGEIEVYTTEGQAIYNNDSEHYLDLVEVSPYEDFKVDDPVMVSNNETFWGKAHFAGVNSEGKPMAYINGKTSWSTGGCARVWEYCRKPAAEEIAK